MLTEEDKKLMKTIREQAQKLSDQDLAQAIDETLVMAEIYLLTFGAVEVRH